MAEAIYSWMRNLAYYFIFMTAVLNLLPDDRYRSYIKSFMGMLLILVVLSPILTLGDIQGKIEEIFQREDVRLQSTETFQYSVDVDEIRRKYLNEAMETEIRIQVQQRLRMYDLEEKEIRISLQTTDTIRVERLEILLDGENTEHAKAGQLSRELQELYDIGPEQVYVG